MLVHVDDLGCMLKKVCYCFFCGNNCNNSFAYQISMLMMSTRLGMTNLLKRG